MIAEEQRIAIAKACGWKWLRHPDVIEATQTYTLKDKWVMNPSGKLVFPHDAPDYLNDLNAIHNAVANMPAWERSAWARELRTIVVRDHKDSDIHPDTGTINDGAFYNATAARRCEAFLKAKGLWTDS